MQRLTGFLYKGMTEMQKEARTLLNFLEVDIPNPSTQPKATKDDAIGQDSTSDQETRGLLHNPEVDIPNPSTQPQATKDDTIGQDSTSDQETRGLLHNPEVDIPNPSTQPQATKDDTIGQDSTSDQETRGLLHNPEVDIPNSSTQPQATKDDTIGQGSTSDQVSHIYHLTFHIKTILLSDLMSYNAKKRKNRVKNHEIQFEPVHWAVKCKQHRSLLLQIYSSFNFSKSNIFCNVYPQETRGLLNNMEVDIPNPSTQPQATKDDTIGQDSTSDQVSHIYHLTFHIKTILLSDLMSYNAKNFFCCQIVASQSDVEISVPKLRRTKSVIMKDINLEDSAELYDSASESGDDYIPDTTCESDSDSDTSLHLSPKTQRSLADKTYVPDPVSSPEVDSTTPDHLFLPSKATGAEEEPCSSQNINDVIVVTACQKRAGKRVYDKRHYCLYCSKPYAKMARHLEAAHMDISSVAKALSFPKGSKKRKLQLDYIRNQGNFAHNAAVMESGKGKLVAFKRPVEELEGKDFMHCAYCQALFTRKVLWRHMRRCRLRPESVTPKPGKNRVQSMCKYAEPVPSYIKKELWEVISSMNPDPITDIIKNDKVILDIGQHLLNKGGSSDKNKQNVREKMRELGRLIKSARRGTTLNKMEDLINPEKYMETVKAVKLTCGYESDTNKFLIPSLAIKLGNALVKASKLLKAQGLISNNNELVKNASGFQEVHQEKWNEVISATALRNIREAKWNVPTLMPFTQDVQKMHTYLSQMQDEWHKSLSESPSTRAWMELAKVCLAQIILFNRRREGEVSSMPLSAFLSRDSTDAHEDVDWALSEVEKKLCRHFSRIVIRGKRGRPVPILLTPKMLCLLELLVKQREACGVLNENCYMFARPGAMSHFRGSDCLRSFAKGCNAKCPRSLTSTRLRKHAATLSTVLNMTDTEMDQLANFLGHDIRIHREFYRLPEKTLQLAKISKVLMALEQGRLSDFHGKNLDEIRIEPDEKVLDSEEEEDDRSIQGETSTVEEPSAEGLCPPTEESEMQQSASKRRRPPSPGDEVPPGGAMKPSSKGKAPQKKQKKMPWQQREVQAVERHLKRFITSCIVPSKSDCQKCLSAEPEALKDRTWQNVKFYVYNRITAFKRKVQLQ
ncbi:uncharacterized protein LOC124050300 [Xyrichtys novacula]|uniref:Uncharacterized protein LOC124050300 n=1 Tax=Xyrichtys novacula TaxID=13765 RepID=A0AAV1FB49_XYRNO|nr:uncharacterized protein LOC124050300 [Xyrichtys novacula]